MALKAKYRGKGSKNQKPTHFQFVVTGIPRALKNKFKAACELNDRKMTQVIQEFMRDYIQKGS